MGGATTGVHSIAEGLPTQPQVFAQGLPEPKVKRTVEGDLGMRSGAMGLLEHFTPEVIAGLASLPVEKVVAGVQGRTNDPHFLPDSLNERRLETTLAYLAVKEATERHVGKIQRFYTPQGVCYLQEGKDLTTLETVIGTGGVLVHSPAIRRILSGVLPTPDRPELLKPHQPRCYVDERYLFSTLGLIADQWPEVSFYLLEKALRQV